jgi:hypothetical protein
MTHLTVETVSTSEGFDFIRNDGEHFFLVGTESGSAILYHGPGRNRPPATDIVELDVSVTDKLEAAHRWVLAYPDPPA